jgi:hypothetical protein
LWIGGFLAVPFIVLANELYALDLPPVVLIAALVFTLVAFVVAISAVRASVGLRIGLFVLTAVLWWAADFVLFVLFFFRPG